MNHMDTVAAAYAIHDLLDALGVPADEHTANTPARVARAWHEQLAGYREDPTAHLTKTFPAPPEPGLVMVGGIRVVSTCAHHLLPIVGVATVAYRPRTGHPVVGLSKLARVVDGYARRLQVQERLGHDVAHAVQTALDPVGAACLITAAHGCMSLRGVGQPATVTTTHAWAGQWNNAGDLTGDRMAVQTEHTRTTTAFKGGPVW